ncbi:hypothetical protein ACFL54_02330 [Planctomycetota bacterium]
MGNPDREIEKLLQHRQLIPPGAAEREQIRQGVLKRCRSEFANATGAGQGEFRAAKSRRIKNIFLAALAAVMLVALSVWQYRRIKHPANPVPVRTNYIRHENPVARVLYTYPQNADIPGLGVVQTKDHDIYAMAEEETHFGYTVKRISPDGIIFAPENAPDDETRLDKIERPPAGFNFSGRIPFYYHRWKQAELDSSDMENLENLVLQGDTAALAFLNTVMEKQPESEFAGRVRKVLYRDKETEILRRKIRIALDAVENHSYRLNIIRNLGKNKSPLASSALRQIAANPGDIGRTIALECLVENRDQPSIAILQEILAEEKIPAEMRKYCRKSLDLLEGK